MMRILALGICLCLGCIFFLLKNFLTQKKYTKLLEKYNLVDIQKMRDEKKLPLCFLMEKGNNEGNDFYVLFSPNEKFLERKALYLDLLNKKVYTMNKKYLFRLNKSFVLGRIENNKVVEIIKL